MLIGVLALQGAFQEHVAMLRRLSVQAREIRKPAELTGVDALIIPGGESTAMGKIGRVNGLYEPIRALARAGRPVWGTCAGLILLAHDIDPEPPHLDLMDIKVRRNAFGRQVDSFETDLHVPALGPLDPSVADRPFPAIFIRAPLIESTGPGVQVLARLWDGAIVAVRQGNLLATSFHPELTGDPRFHRFFLSLAA